MKKRYLQLILISVLAVALLTACAEEANEYVSGKDIIDAAIEEAEQEVMDNRITKKEAFDKHYKNGLYFEDFGNLPNELNELMTPVVQSRYESLGSYPLVAEAKMEYYNLTLKKYRDGEITFEEIAENPVEYIRNWNVWIYMFEDKMNSEWKKERKLIGFAENEALEFPLRGGGECEVHVVLIEDFFLEDYTLNDLKNSRDKQKYLLERATPFRYFYLTENGLRSSSIIKGNKLVDAPLPRIEEKYNEKFEFIGIESGNHVAAPISNLNYKFQVGLGYDQGDRYLSVLVQSYMTKKVYELIEEEGMTGQIFPFVMPTDNTYIFNSMNELEYNTGEGFDIEHFIENVYEGDYDFSLYYMVDSEDDIDYAMLQRLMGKIYDIPYNTWNSEDELNNWRKSIFAFIYSSSAEDRNVLEALFNEHRVSADEFPVRLSTRDISSSRDSVRADTDQFNYIDVYCGDVLHIYKSYNNPLEKELSEFITHNRYRSLYQK